MSPGSANHSVRAIVKSGIHKLRTVPQLFHSKPREFETLPANVAGLYTQLFDPSKYSHWCTTKKFQALRFRKYYAGISMQYITLFEHDTKEFVGIYDLSGCVVTKTRKGEFTVHGGKLLDPLTFQGDSEEEVYELREHLLFAACYLEELAAASQGDVAQGSARDGAPAVAAA